MSRAADCIKQGLKEIFLEITSILRKKRPTSLSEFADAFRRLAVLIKSTVRQMYILD